MSVYTLLAVALGGAMGAMARYLVGAYWLAEANKYFPFATLLVNISGCLAMGYCVAYFQAEECQWPDSIKVGVTAGLLGGLTTFSTFSMETLTLIQNEQMFKAALNTVLSVALGLLAVLLGMHIFSTK